MTDHDIEREPENAPEGGSKKDAGKPRYDLIPPAVLHELAILYQKGAEKYADRNWEKGIHYSRCYRALLSHAFKYFMGEDYDKVDGQHHMDSVAWYAIAIRHYDLHPNKYREFDDRPRYNDEPE